MASLKSRNINCNRAPSRPFANATFTRGRPPSSQPTSAEFSKSIENVTKFPSFAFFLSTDFSMISARLITSTQLRCIVGVM